MELDGKRIGFAVTGSHCTFDQVLPQLKRIVEAGGVVTPILSKSVQNMDTKFGTAEEWKTKITEITDQEPKTTIVEAEPIGPDKLLDILIVAPCTGNTLAKIANAITDTPVLMAVKSHLRNNRPVVLALASNDGLGNNAHNLGKLLNTKNIYFVPFGQDNPQRKINSLVARMDLIPDTLEYALEERQIQPVLIEYKGI
ncbi:dipicolinate synthase subunit B [Acetohalobium arabaticum]|uniref:Dipicolinic acid synthetase, B subunit n=1 Tax=Acetohalobium arabaticum (strain ATCC 49924 / DSM 5501 / Z-7288) TaxID=574087 RepID=D9QRE3_ACEAZ|nr:dipicolinate synthase subunit B [Acetohalobium arabaticum]ADL13084.1 dipicolinic acid synthetase, B subunit [Acetohalobium arabaticum DSM 5501]